MDLYQFDDGEFEFFTASNGTLVTIFRVRADTWPERRAREKDIIFDYIRPSSVKEIMRWMETHPSFPVKEVFGPEGKLLSVGESSGIITAPERW